MEMLSYNDDGTLISENMFLLVPEEKLLPVHSEGRCFTVRSVLVGEHKQDYFSI